MARPHPRDREKYNAYMRKYMNERYHRRMNAARKALGGKCRLCGSISGLQFDHIDPATKNFELGSLGPNISQARFDAELKLCQLLCTTCHAKKTCAETGKQYVKGTHGSLSTYRDCGPPKCDLCRKAKREWMRQYREKTRSSAV